MALTPQVSLWLQTLIYLDNRTERLGSWFWDPLDVAAQLKAAGVSGQGRNP